MSMPESKPLPASAPLLPAAGQADRPILVTGGAGFVGSHLVELLLAEGYAVHVVDDLSTGRTEHLAAVLGHPRLRFTVASIESPSVAAAACAGAGMAFHLAGAVGVRWLAREPLAVMQRNLRASEVLLAAAAEHRCPVLLASSSEVYGDGPVPFREADSLRPGSTEGLRGGYACAKAMAEWLALGYRQASGLPVLVARLFNTVGPRQAADQGMVLPRFVRQALAGEPITVYGDGQQTRCFAHVGDVVQALLGLARARGLDHTVFNVGSRVETTVGEVATLVRRLAGSRSPIVLVPYQKVFPAGFVDPPRRVPDTSRLRQALGWEPERPLAAILRELVDGSLPAGAKPTAAPVAMAASGTSAAAAGVACSPAARTAP